MHIFGLNKKTKLSSFCHFRKLCKIRYGDWSFLLHPDPQQREENCCASHLLSHVSSVFTMLFLLENFFLHFSVLHNLLFFVFFSYFWQFSTNRVFPAGWLILVISFSISIFLHLFFRNNIQSPQICLFQIFFLQKLCLSSNKWPPTILSRFFWDNFFPIFFTQFSPETSPVIYSGVFIFSANFLQLFPVMSFVVSLSPASFVRIVPRMGCVQWPVLPSAHPHGRVACAAATCPDKGA